LQVVFAVDVRDVPYDASSDSFTQETVALRGDIACLLSIDGSLVTINGTEDLSVRSSAPTVTCMPRLLGFHSSRADGCHHAVRPD
jgi:hypothetical protein